jgi:4-hydroxythreonine-4-phosphate dehydrogenase
MKIGITIGDPCGVGEEVTLKALAELKDTRNFEVKLYGFYPEIVDSANLGEGITLGTSPGIPFKKGKYNCLSDIVQLGTILAALDDIKKNVIHSIVTSPINKRIFSEFKLSFMGLTEFLAHETGSKNFAMVLTGSKLTVLTVTTHIPLSLVPKVLKQSDIVNKTKLLNDFMIQKKSIIKPKIGILSLNPHAGERGLVGREEIEIISPAIEILMKLGIDAHGPLSADSAFYRAVNGEFSALVSMYHDQGLPPLKLIHFEDAVNITLGLPFIRTSPCHGVAYDLAGTGRANPESMKNAILTAAG